MFLTMDHDLLFQLGCGIVKFFVCLSEIFYLKKKKKKENIIQLG